MTNLKERGFTNITKIVFAFKGKEVKMEVVNQGRIKMNKNCSKGTDLLNI